MHSTCKCCSSIADDISRLSKNRYENRDEKFWYLANSICTSKNKETKTQEVQKETQKVQKEKEPDTPIPHPPVEYKVLARNCHGLHPSFHMVHVIADMNNLNVKVHCKDTKGNLLSQFETMDQRSIFTILQWYIEMCIQVRYGAYSDLLNTRYINKLNRQNPIVIPQTKKKRKYTFRNRKKEEQYKTLKNC